MIEQFSRTELLLGEEAMQKLYKARVAVFGVGGVGVRTRWSGVTSSAKSEWKTWK